MRSLLTRRAAGIALPLLLAALPFLFFWRLFAPNLLDRMWLPDGDLTQQYYPLRVFAARELAAGRLPLWNPHLFAGQPGLADSQVAALYPINLLTDLLLGWLGRPFTFAIFQLQIVAHYSLAALFTYGFARRITGKRFAAGVAALVFTFGGYLTAYPAEQATILASAVWLPLVLWLLDWAAAQSRPRLLATGTAAAGAAMAVSILAGHPQTAIYVFYMAIAYWIYRTRGLSLSKGRGAVCPLSSILRHPLLYLIVFVFFALGLSAIQWLPTLEFTRFSTRAQVNYAFTSHGFAPYEIVTLLIPGYLGGSPLYIGIIPMLLAVAAFDDRAGAKPHAGGLLVDAVMRARGFAPTAAFFWLLTAFVALLLSFGDALFAYPLAYLFAPGFAQVRDQERIALLWSFALAMLAALGAARLGRPFSRAARVRLAGVERRLGGLTAGLVALIALAYGGMLASADQKVNLFPGALRQLVPAFFWLAAAWGLWRLRLHVAVSRRWLMIATLGLIGLNLFSVNAPSHFQQPTPSDYYPETTLVQTLRAELKAHPLARVASEGLLPGAHNAGADFDFQEITGNDPLQLAETAQFDRTMQELRKWQLLGVRYIITRREIAHGAFSLVASEGEAHLYRNAEALPRAWLVHAVEVVPADVYGVLNRPDFDPAQVVALNAEPPIALPASAPAASPVEVAAYAPGRLSLRARAAANGLLVIGEVYYPGWQAVVDGQRAPLLRADSILMAVPLSAGPHQVELTFEPDSVKIGGLISGLTLLAWLVIIARSGILTLPRHRTPIR